MLLRLLIVASLWVRAMGLFHRHKHDQQPLDPQAPKPLVDHQKQLPAAPQLHPHPPPQCPAPAANGFKNVVYFANWLVYARKHFAADIPVDQVSHVFYAFCHIDANTGKLKFTDEWCDLQLPMADPRDPLKKVEGSIAQLQALKQTHRHLKAVLSIGGWATEGQFQGMVALKDKLKAFITLCGDFIKKYKFDGIDVDWEYPQKHEMALFVELLAGIRRELDSIRPGLSLLIAAPAGMDKLAQFDFKGIDRYLDFWNVMCYDFAGGWSTKTGYHANLFGDNGDNPLNCDDVIKYYIKHGIHPSRLVMGMPLYGRNFFGAATGDIGAPFTKERGPNPPVDQDTVDYNKLIPGQQNMDPRKVGALVYDPKAHLFITYDDVQCTRIKARYIQLNGLGGGMWWDLAGDTKDPQTLLVQTFFREMGGPEKLDHTPNWLG